jgi:hypothetical protein
MNNFRHTGTFDYQPILSEIVANPAWNWLNLRSYAGHTRDIILRYQSVETNKTIKDFYTNPLCVDYFVQSYFPKTMQLIRNHVGDKSIGRIVIAELTPGQQVAPHIDEGFYSDNTDRHHFVVSTNVECVMMSGNEHQHMPRGTIWWFNNHVTHSADNKGTTTRIHVIVDTYKDDSVNL